MRRLATRKTRTTSRPARPRGASVTSTQSSTPGGEASRGQAASGAAGSCRSRRSRRAAAPRTARRSPPPPAGTRASRRRGDPVGPVQPGLAWPSSTGWPGRTATPGHRDAADLGEHGGGVVAAPAAGPGDDEHEVGVRRRPPDLGGQRVGVVRLHRADRRHRADLPASRGEHERVGVGDVAGRSAAPTGLISSPVGMIATAGRRATASVACPPAAAAARSPGRSRRPAGTRSSPAAKSSPGRTDVPAARRQVAAGPRPRRWTLPSSCGSSRSRIITVSVPAGIGSPVSIHSNVPAASRTAPPRRASPAAARAAAAPPAVAAA